MIGRCYAGCPGAVNFRFPCRKGAWIEDNSRPQQGTPQFSAQKLTFSVHLLQIDLPNLTPSLLSRAAQQIETTFSLDPSEILYISAKSGKGVEDILKAVVERIPAPPQPAHVLEGKAPKERLKAFLFDSLYVLSPRPR